MGDIGEYLEEGAAAFAFPGGRTKSWVSWLVGWLDLGMAHIHT